MRAGIILLRFPPAGDACIYIYISCVSFFSSIDLLLFLVLLPPLSQRKAGDDEIVVAGTPSHQQQQQQPLHQQPRSAGRTWSSKGRGSGTVVSDVGGKDIDKASGIGTYNPGGRGLRTVLRQKG